MARRKARAKDLKKQRWAAIVAAVLALGMLASLVGVYLGQAAGGSAPLSQDQTGDFQPEDYLAYYENEVERLENHLEEHQPSTAVLFELAQNYRYLIYINQAFFDDQQKVQQYQDRLASLYGSLIELEPSNPEYRLELIRLYLEGQDDEDLVANEIALLQDILDDTPDPLVQLSLISLLDSAGKKDLFDVELSNLQQHLENKVAEGLANNEDLFYYSVLLGEYLDNPGEAKLILDKIMAEEDADSWIYQEAMNYRGYLQVESGNDAFAD